MARTLLAHRRHRLFFVHALGSQMRATRITPVQARPLVTTGTNTLPLVDCASMDWIILDIIQKFALIVVVPRRQVFRFHWPCS